MCDPYFISPIRCVPIVVVVVVVVVVTVFVVVVPIVVVFKIITESLVWPGSMRTRLNMESLNHRLRSPVQTTSLPNFRLQMW
jgi:hypothetical protein